MEIRVVADENTNILFQLMGFKTLLIDDRQPDEFEKRFNKLLENDQIGVIIMSDKYLLRHRDYFRKIKVRKYPIVVEIPDLASPMQYEYFEEFLTTYLGLTYENKRN